ncbi:MAG: hypothetical protein ACLR2G_03190 [Phascolarctobacterium faecium]
MKKTYQKQYFNSKGRQKKIYGKENGKAKELKLAMVVGCILTSSNAWAADITGNSSSGCASLKPDAKQRRCLRLEV